MSLLSKLIQITVALLCLGAAVVILRDNGLPRRAASVNDSGQIRTPVIGSPAPSFTSQNHKSEIFSLRTAPGATILNFWATWCQPCRAEMTALQAMVESTADPPRVIAVNLGESFTTINQWVADLQLTYTVLLDPQLAIAALYGVRGLPTTYLLDSQMTIKKVYYGPVNADELLRNIDGFTVEPS